MRARACIRCKEYVLVHPEDPMNLGEIKEFEMMHEKHGLVTLDLEEIAQEYKKIAQKAPEIAM